MMRLIRPGLLLGLFVLTASPAQSEIYQWTDSRGVIHFTDDVYAVPGPVRGSPDLIVRKDFVVEKESPTPAPRLSEAPEPISTPKPTPVDRSDGAEAEPVKTVPIVVSYQPQEVTIVVVNPPARRPRKNPCLARESCKPAFRPDFNDRRYIHPSVFDGGSRQYIQPR